LALDDGGTQVPAFGFLNQGLGPCGLGFQGYAWLAELAQISEYREPAEILSTAMTRKWVEITNKGEGDKADKIREITERMEELKVRELFREAVLKEELFGRAQIYIQIKKQDSDEARQLPFDIEQMQKDSLESLTCIEPYWSTPYSYNASYPERKDFYVPQSWFIMGRKTHSTRLLTFIFREVPDLLKPAYNFSGISMTQLIEPYVTRWLRTAKNVNDIINIYSIVNLATDLETVLQDEENGGLVGRVQGFTQLRDNRGMMITNKDTEELNVQAVPLSGLDKLQAQAQEHMAAPCHIPLIVRFGTVPTGLNSDGGEGEMKVWDEFVLAMQEHGFSQNFRKVLELVQMDLYGAIDDDITFRWVPLSEPTAKELSDMRKTDADRDVGYITAGVVSPDEVRQKLQNDPDSGYDGLVGEAPEPEQDGVDDGELAAQGQEHEGEQADADREHEATENQKDRDHEMRLAKVKAAKPASK
jgi:phage-related protein (TIGR01555 family)